MTVPVRYHDLLHRAAALLQRERFTMFGGAARDLLVDDGATVHDLDIAVDGTPADAHAMVARLATDPQVRRVTPLRSYWIFYRHPLVMFTADLDGITLDINVMACPLRAHFDVETVQWSYPGLKVDDPYQVATGPVERIRLIGSLDDDNPVLLLSRVLRLAAKYDLPLRAQPLVTALCTRAARWRCTDAFHGVQAHDAHHRAVADAVIRSNRPAAFLADCLLSGVLDARLRPLADVLRAWPAHLDRLASQEGREAWWQVADQLVGEPDAAWRAHAASLAADIVFDPGEDHQNPLPAGVDLAPARWTAFPASASASA